MIGNGNIPTIAAIRRFPNFYGHNRSIIVKLLLTGKTLIFLEILAIFRKGSGALQSS